MKKFAVEFGNKKSLSAKILFCTTFITLGVLMNVGVVLFFWFRIQTREDYRTLMKATAANIDATFCYYMENTQNMMVQWFRSTDGTLCRLEEDFSQAEHISLLTDIHNSMENIPYLHSVYFLNRYGECSFFAGAGFAYTENLEELLLPVIEAHKIADPFIWQVKSRYKDAKDITLLSMYFSDTESDRANFAGAAVVNIDTAALSRTLFSDSGEAGPEWFILDVQGNVIAHSDVSRCGENWSDQVWVKSLLSEKSGILERKEDGRKLEVSWQSSALMGFYIVTQTESVGGYQAGDAANIIFLILFAAAFLIIVLTLPICRRIFRPLNTMISDMKQQLVIEDTGDEVQFLNHYYTRLTRQIANLSEKEEKDFIVKNLLVGNQEEEVQQILLRRGIVLENTGYYMIYAYLMSPSEDNRSMQEYNVQKELVSGIISSGLEQLGKCTCFEVGLRRMLFVFSEEEGHPTEERTVQQLLQGAGRSAEQLIENRICLLLSRKAESGSISSTVIFKDMEESLKTRVLVESGRTRREEKETEHAIWRPLKEESGDAHLLRCKKKLLAAVRKGQKEEYLRLLEAVLEECENKKYEEFLDFFTELAEQVVQIRTEILPKKNEADGKQLREQLRKITDYQELQEWFDGLYEAATVQINRVNNHSNAAQMEEAVDYIRNHYDDCNLNVNTLALRLNISAAYFGKLFRDFAGCSALEFITRTRMERAYEMLLTEQWKDISRIARETGYSNNAYFATAFKKYYGVAPSRLRDYHTAAESQKKCT